MPKRTLWCGAIMLIAGAWIWWHALSVASLSMLQCHNDYGVSAPDWQCRKVFYYSWAGISLFGGGVSLALFGSVWRLIRRDGTHSRGARTRPGAS